MSSFISSEDAAAEPYADIISMLLIVVGFVVFFAVVVQSYNAYEDRVFIVHHYKDAQDVAEMLRKDASLAADRGDLIDAAKVAGIASECPGGTKCTDFFSKFGGQYNLKVKIEAENFAAVIWKTGTEPEYRISASVPVTVHLNGAEDSPGTLKVMLWRK